MCNLINILKLFPEYFIQDIFCNKKIKYMKMLPIYPSCHWYGHELALIVPVSPFFQIFSTSPHTPPISRENSRSEKIFIQHNKLQKRIFIHQMALPCPVELFFQEILSVFLLPFLFLLYLFSLARPTPL